MIDRSAADPSVSELLERTALVLEGGGLRGVYTSGVLRFFMAQGLRFGYVIGVSMGACNAANYISNQPERNRIVNIRFVKDRRYLSYLRLLVKGELFGMNFIFDTVPNQLVPFDYDMFHRSPLRCVVTVTDCMTGDAVYYEKSQLGDNYLKVLQASCSLPFMAHPIQYDGRILMDGGLADAIPLARSMQDGNLKHVLVLTRPRGYRKQPSPWASLLVRLRYPRFKGLQRTLASRAASYNATLEWIESLEDEGRVFVVRPLNPLLAGRVERNKDNLYLTYDQGYADAESCHEYLLDYLRNGKGA
jgi:predicted patatin/cPLA2 family phospholipase